MDAIRTDLLVVGGGLAGCCAAIAAKRTAPDHEVWLVERYGFLGGMATAGLVYPMMRYSTRDPATRRVKRLVGGVFQEIMARMHERGYTARRAAHGLHSRFDPFLMRGVLDQLVEEAGVHLLFHGLVNAVEGDPAGDAGDAGGAGDAGDGINDGDGTGDEDGTDVVPAGRRVRAVVVQTKAGPVRVDAKLVIDATGDADVVFHAGGAYAMGRESDGLVQPATLNFRVGHLGLRAPGRRKITRLIRDEKTRGNPLTPRDDCLMFLGLRHRVRHFNQTRVAGYDFTDPLEMTAAEVEGRRQAERFIRFLRDRVPGYKKSTVVGMGAQLGVRESRRIRGDYELTADDLMGAVQFPDRVALGNYPIDIHDPKGSARTDLRHLPRGKFYSIPYRCLLPVRFDNVLVVGRPVSATHVAHSAIRVMPICSAIGHAGGVAAALALQAHAPPGDPPGSHGPPVPRAVPVGELQAELRRQGAVLE